jgi:inosine-uridine nucleoside N-ribohydrolase
MVVYDTDMGSDDWIAALLLLRSPRLEVKGITVTGAGLTRREPGVRNALALAALAGEVGIPVAGGRTTPLRGTAHFPDEWRDTADRLCGLPLATNDPIPASQTAPELITSLAQIADRRIDIVATGPLTNVAEALTWDSTLASRLRMIYIMGGAVGVPGNVVDVYPLNKVAEWNIFVDPHAAAVVLASGVSVTLVPLDATNEAPVTVEFYLRLAQRHTTPWADFVFRVLTKRIESIRKSQYFFWDPLAAAIAIDERFTRISEKSIRIVETEGPHSGQTEAVAEGGYPVRVCNGADRVAFEDFFLDTLNA